jgi:hypothetical protein
MCRDIFPLLKKGGVLLLVCHNRRSLSARILGTRSPIFDIEHLQLFSRRSVQFLMNAAGYRDIQIRAVYNRYPLSYWVKLFPLPGAIKRSAMTVVERTGIGRLPLMLPAGNLAVAGFKRQ